MADLKISQLGSIVTVVPATDVLPVVQGATTYKVTPNQILGSGGVATLASATITGALTVDTTTLVVDATNDRVGIGTATPSYKFHAVATSGAVGAFRASTAAIARLLVGNTVGDLEIKVNANSDGQITSDAGKYLGLGSNTSNDRVILDTSGNLSITNGNVVMATSGKGIDFSAVTGGTGTATGNVLNDYEEGTWTATLKGATTDPTTAVTATGKYTKVGRQVSVQVYIANVITTGASGRIFIAGLPFSNNSTTVAIGATAFYDIATFTGSPFGELAANGTTVEMYSSVSNSAYQPVTHNAGINRYLYLNLTYTV